MLYEKYYNTFDKLDRSKTYLFEIVHPNNRIVVDYKGMEDLILIAVVDTETGYDEDIDKYSYLGFTMVGEFEHREIKDLIEDNISNKEGYILKFTNGFRVKIKFEEYVHNHKYITGISSYTIWEMLKNGESDEVILEVLPDEMYDWYNKVKAELTTQFDNIKNAVSINVCFRWYYLNVRGQIWKHIIYYFLNAFYAITPFLNGVNFNYPLNIPDVHYYFQSFFYPFFIVVKYHL